MVFIEVSALAFVIIGLFVESSNAKPHHSQQQNAHHWTYKDTSTWTSPYKDCGGRFQSPINIDPSAAVFQNYESFTFGNYDNVAPMNITNNGHSILLHLPDDYPDPLLPFIRGGGLSDTYKFVQLHFHWGSDSLRGSEHLIDFRSYAAEMHMVHYKGVYGSFAEATKHPDGLAVLGILIETQTRDNTAFRHIVQQFSQITEEGEETNLLKPIPLEDLMPDTTENFYRYAGSLTTPGCQEIVTWTVFDTPIAISENQLEAFKSLIAPDGRGLSNNFRPVLPKHGRHVTYRSHDGNPLRV